MSAYLLREGNRFQAQIIEPGTTDIIRILEKGDLLFDKIPFNQLKEGWWLEDGTFLGRDISSVMLSAGGPS